MHSMHLANSFVEVLSPDRTRSNSTQDESSMLIDCLVKDDAFRKLRNLQDKVGMVDSTGGQPLYATSQPGRQCEHEVRKVMFSLMRKIGEELHDGTGAFAIRSERPTVLDLCMAPGEFTATILRKNPQTLVDAFTLRTNEGGHEVLVRFGDRDSRVRVHFSDITMYAKELGIDEIPVDHPERLKMLHFWPYQTESYDVVISDGQALRMQPVPDYRQSCEATRLTNAQLLLGLRKIKPGGTMIILLHRAYVPRIFRLVCSFDGFADVRLYKPSTAHRERSSFYMVAKNVEPHSTAAQAASKLFRKSWMSATFPQQQDQIGHFSDDNGFPELDSRDAATIEVFAPRFIELARPVWNIQAMALEAADWMKCSRG